MWFKKAICMGGTNQFGTNTWHHNKKLKQMLNQLHLFWDFPKSLINKYSDKSYQVYKTKRGAHAWGAHDGIRQPQRGWEHS